jgi:iron complex outermembrane recepter protein
MTTTLGAVRIGCVRIFFAAAAATLFATTLQAAEDPSLFDLSLEELVNLEVTSVSRRAERLAETTSAVYVITREDIERYGISSIPEALRLVPGLSVLQIDANKWAVGSRGFTGRFANKLLVVMDGRVLYTPSFSGVFWDVQGTLLEDIARIEVIRGPGSTVWGANAVNGVINIITRGADAGSGGKLATRIEDDGSYSTAARFSGTAGEQTHYRVFVKHQDVAGNRNLQGADTADDWYMTRAGGRLDWSPSRRNALSLISEAYDGRMGSSQQLATLSPPYVDSRVIDFDVSGAFLIGRWSHEQSENAGSTVQLTLDSTDRDSPLFSESRRTYMIDAQHQRTLARQELVIGAQYRGDAFDIVGSDTIAISVADPNNHSVSAFIQDQISLLPDKLRLTFGTKVEHNDLSDNDLDLMPSVRLLWEVNDATSVWSAVTRAVRTPSYADLGARVKDVESVIPPGTPENPFPLPIRPSAVGSPEFRSEELLAYELGVRGRFGPAVSYDLALYVMDYDDLRAYAPAGAFCNPSGEPVASNPLCVLASDSILSAVEFNNAATGDVHGLELAVDWDVNARWRLRTAYSYAAETQEATAPNVALAPASGPKHQVTLRSEWSLMRNVRLATWLRYVDAIPRLGLADYWQANVQVNWRVNDQWLLSVGGKNLLGDARLEYLSELNDIVPTEIERSILMRAEWSF